MENNNYDFVRLGEDFFIDLNKEIIKYKDVIYTKGELENDQQFKPAMKRFVKFLLDRYYEGNPIVNGIDLYIAYSSRTNKPKKANMDREEIIRKDHIDAGTVPKFYYKIAQLIVHLRTSTNALKYDEKKKCYIKKNSENQYWYEPPLEKKSPSNPANNKSNRTQNGFDVSSKESNEKDEYYLSAIKEKAFQLDGEDQTRTLIVLKNILFYRRQELSDKAKEQIDNFFADEFVTGLIKQGLNEELAVWYSELWFLWVQRQEHKEKYEKAEEDQNYERMEFHRKHLNQREDEIDAIIEKITIYNNSLDNGGRIQI